MKIVTRSSAALLLPALFAAAAPASLSAQQPAPPATGDSITVQGEIPADLTGLAKGPVVEGIVSARSPNGMQITGADGSLTSVGISDATEIRGRGGFLGLNKTSIDAGSLLNGLPVTVETVQWGDGLVASRIRFRSNDLQTAAMIRGGTAQQFALHGAAIEQNAAATEALRGRMGDIDQYNIKGTTDVHFATGRWTLTAEDGNRLCAAAAEAGATDNALLLVVGYTDSVGSEEYNQTLSEKRAGRVVNHLQQVCGWAPWRMLTPTGMSEADPLASNDTASGKAQNRRVSVNILVSKAVDGV